MINIAVCDDDRFFLELVNAYISGYFKRLDIEAKINLFDSPESFWEHFRTETFHIVILDIIMPGQSGIDLAKQIFRHNRNCVIAFLTSSADYALQGYGVNAVGYLLKPPSGEDMELLLAQCLQRYYETRPRTIMVKTGGVNRKLDASNIIYLESRNKQVMINCRDETLVCQGKLRDFIEMLPVNFVQTHKSYIVNLDHVFSMTRDEMIADSDIRIPISRQYSKDATRRYMEHMSLE